MLSESYLSLKQLSELLEIHENTIKGYMLKHTEFVRFDKEHNRYRIHVSAVETLKTIRRLYGEGHKREAVDEYLRGSDIPVTITVDSEDGGKSLVNLNEEFAEMKEVVKALIEVVQESKNEVQASRNEIQELKQLHQQEFGELKKLLNHHESERVSELRLNMKQVTEEVSASVEVLKEEVEIKLDAERKKGFFQKLFGR